MKFYDKRMALLFEAPLSDFYGIQGISKFPNSNIEQTPITDKDVLRTTKLIDNHDFKRKLERVLQGINVDIDVFVIVGGGAVASSQERVEIFNKSSTQWLRHMDRTVVDGIEKWMDNNRDNDKTLFIVFSQGSGSGITLTPWMVLHAFFDSADTMSQYLQKSPNTAKFRNIISDVIYDVMNPDDRLDGTHAIGIEEFERIFSMGSARSRYFSLRDDGDDPELILADLVNECTVQALTSQGFHYNSDQLLHITDKESRQLIKKQLDTCANLSSSVRKEFEKAIRDRIVAIAVSTK